MNIINILKSTINKEMQNEEGRVIYSNLDTFAKGNIYFLGLNPGGELNKSGSMIISEDLDFLLNHPTRYSVNAYYDEKWGKDGKEWSQPQIRIINFFKSLPKSLNLKCNDENRFKQQFKKIFCSNFVFKRSKNSKGVSKSEICWNSQKFIIDDIVKPCVIITFSKLCYNEFLAKFIKLKEISIYSFNRNDKNKRRMNEPKLSCDEYKNKLLVYIPHFSRNRWDKEQNNRGKIEFLEKLDSTISTFLNNRKSGEYSKWFKE